MGFELTLRQMKILAKAPLETKIAVIGKLTPSDALSFDADFESWAHKAQLPPKLEGWRTWLMLAGKASARPGLERNGSTDWREAGRAFGSLWLERPSTRRGE